MNSVKVIIVAAGSGSRFGSTLPKQYCILSGRPVLMATIDCFRNAIPDAGIVLVISESMADYWSSLCAQFDFESPAIVFGGATRAESVKNALQAMDCDGDAVILIHDGARPLVDSDTICRVVSGIGDPDVDGVIPVVAVTDSLRKVEDGGCSAAVDRSRFKAVQTPQCFHFGKLLKAYDTELDSTITDDASAMERAGFGRIILAEGNPENIKITHPYDILLAEAIISSRK